MKRRRGRGWNEGEQDDVMAMTMTRRDFAERLGGRATEARAPVVVDERDPGAFRVALADAAAGRGPVFLANPDWGTVERAQFEALVRVVPADFEAESGWLMIPTGGSSGRIKLARHDQGTILAAVGGFAAHFGTTVVNAVGLLPQHHVGGLMAWLRCVLTGGEMVDASWREWAAFSVADWAAVRVRPGSFVSLVPTQLARLLRNDGAVSWLRSFEAVLVGGGPSWATLLAEARRLGVPLAPSYGMTETAAMIAAMRPAEFFAGEVGVGTAMPHATITAAAEDGRLSITSAALFRGYWPDGRAGLDECWAGGDWGRVDERGKIAIGGRVDALIISGGEKIDPAEVEAALGECGMGGDVVVVGQADADWGQRVVACYPRAMEVPEPAVIEVGLAWRLAKFKWPKRYVPVSPWPVNAMGKVDRTALGRAVADLAD